MNENSEYNPSGLYMMLTDAKNGVFVPDVIINLDYGMFKHPLLTKKEFPQATWILESGDDPQSFYHNARKATEGVFDIILSPDIRACQQYVGMGYKSMWFPHFADESMYPESMYSFKPTIDAVTTRSKDDAFFKQVKERLGDRFETTNGLHALGHTEFLMKGSIVLQNSQYKEITRRLFEGMLASRMVIADRPDPQTRIDLIFKENEDIVYFDSLDDCIDKVNYYTKNDSERIRIAKNGFVKVKKNHTTAARVKALISQL
jgi:hypothetical protein